MGKLSIVCILALVSFKSSIGLAQIYLGRSLMIRDYDVMNRFNKKYNLGFQVGRVGELYIRRGRTTSTMTPGMFFADIFETAASQQYQHDRAPTMKRLGGASYNSHKHDKIFKQWRSHAAMDATKTAAALQTSPFRLLAIANRMDLAGDMDDRGLPPTGWEPKSLGEVHLIYGYVNPRYESRKGQAFPETWVLSYRLPPLRRSGSRLLPDAGISQKDLIFDENEWEDQMKLWADLWVNLSKNAPRSSAFRARLNTLLDLAVQPENFLAVRANTKLNHTEFELREWYVLGYKNYKASLQRRKPRREPYKCLNNEPLLKDLVNDYWVPEYGDLDMTTLSFDSPRAPSVHARGLNGFTIFRTKNQANYVEPLNHCRDFDDARSPFVMTFNAGGTNPLLVAPFARTNKSFRWTLPGVFEKRRHQFAIRTCSGCHGAETVTDGFHIRPRLAFQNSEISTYLSGRAPNTFKIRSNSKIVYRYSELNKRRQWLDKAFKRQATLFESLIRKDH